MCHGLSFNNCYQSIEQGIYHIDLTLIRRPVDNIVYYEIPMLYGMLYQVYKCVYMPSDDRC